MATLRSDAERAKRFALREGLDVARLGAHAGQTETSMMPAHRPDPVQMSKTCEGYVGDLSAAAAEFMTTRKVPPVDTLSPAESLEMLVAQRGSWAKECSPTEPNIFRKRYKR